MNVAERLAEFAVGAKPQLENSLLSAAKTAIFDGVACMIGGTREEFGRILHDYALMLVNESGQSTVAASNIRTSPSSAAYINAASGHSLCYDDTSNAMMGHPTIVVLPACLAVGEWTGASGAELIDAYAIGVEIAVRVSELLAPGHYLKGWHATGISAGIGAAAACSRLLGLDQARTARALNIAATSAQGLRGNFGSMAMIYHIGLAARGGVDAALLAANGMTSTRDAFDGPIGYFKMFEGTTEAFPNDAIFETLGKPYELVSPGLDVKPYPCGSLGHRAIQGVIELRNDNELKSENIASITCQIPELHQQVLVNVHPKDILESRINLVYPVSVAAVTGTCGIDDFSYELMRNKEVLRLMDKVRVEGAKTEDLTGAGLFAAPAKVTIETVDGSIFSRTVVAVKGSPQLPLSAIEWDEKFDNCVVPSLGSKQANELKESLARLETINRIGELTKMMAAKET